MLILIENEPREYAWGSCRALPEMLGKPPTGRPQAELWMGVHPLSPSRLAKVAPEARTLVDLIESDPDRYGVDGAPLPFLLKLLAIDAPLSLQAHPSLEQAAAGYERENAAGIPVDAPHRNYRDRNHKPELLVALGYVQALSGFRPLREARIQLEMFLGAAEPGGGKEILARAIAHCAGDDEAAARRGFLAWALDPASATRAGALELARIVAESSADSLGIDPLRLASLRRLGEAYPGDPGILVSLLLNVVALEPGEAIFLAAGQLHAYLSGLAVEVMASSDNVLRGGLTVKHIDTAELCSVTDFAALESPRFSHREVGPGLVAWEPQVPDFRLMRARVARRSGDEQLPPENPETVGIPAESPLILVVTEGKISVERREKGIVEIAKLRRGQALYISAGEAVEIGGDGEAYLATVGALFA